MSLAKRKRLAKMENCYKKCYGCNPSIDKLDEYFYLFFDSMDEEQRKIFDYKLNLMGNYEESLKAANGRSMFKSYEDFIEYCDNNEK